MEDLESISRLTDHQLIQKFNDLEVDDVFTISHRNALNSKLYKIYCNSNNKISKSEMMNYKKRSNEQISNDSTSVKGKILFFSGFIYSFRFSKSKFFYKILIFKIFFVKYC